MFWSANGPTAARTDMAQAMLRVLERCEGEFCGDRAAEGTANGVRVVAQRRTLHVWRGAVPNPVAPAGAEHHGQAAVVQVAQRMFAQSS